LSVYYELINVRKMVEKRGIPNLIVLTLVLASIFGSCSLYGQKELKAPDNIICGAERIEAYIDLLKGKRVGLVANPSSRIGETHLLDSLLSLGIGVEVILCPEHGFRGTGEAGEQIVNHKDPVTGIDVISIYGNKKKPDPADIEGVDLLIFDIQDVGARFYTYISTLHFVMEAAAENEKQVIILDRPNPNGFYVDGPLREEGFESFVGMHPIPVVHGMTIGEYGKMINNEGWLLNSVKCELVVIPCLNYDHLCKYNLPVKPSPNLPNIESVILYPSLCFFEGTIASIGRGTDQPFQVYGHNDMKGDFHFRPVSIPGASLHPKLEGLLCKGYDLRKAGVNRILSERMILLDWLIDAYKQLGSKDEFFTSYFNTLMGNSWVKEDIKNRVPEDEIRAKWEIDVVEFKVIRKKYLLYEDFE